MRILTAFMLWLATAGVASADVSLGLAKDDAWNSGDHIARMESHGLTDHAVVYYALTSDANLANPYDWVRDNYVNAGIQTIMTLIIDDRSVPGTTTVGTSEGTDVSAGVPGLLQRVIDGEFDDALQALAVRIRDNGRPLTIRPFHELDGSWYQWGIYADGNSRGLAIAAVAHLVRLFDRVGAENVRWEINFNRRDGQTPGQVLGEAEYLLPRLNELVDQYSVSTYNRCGTAPWYGEERSFADDFRPIYERIAALSELPINVAEVSTSGLCGPRVPWFEQMLDELDQFPQLEMVTFFFGTVPVGRASNDVPIYWGFDEEPEFLPEFRSLIEAARAAWQQDARAAPERAPAPLPTPRVAPARTQIVLEDPEPLRFPADSSVGEPVTVLGSACQTALCFQSTPWSAWGVFTYPLHEEGNPALNPVTGNEFGETGPLFRWTLTQRGLWDEGDFEHGPGLRIGGVHSTNRDQWWNNNLDLGLTYGLYFDAPRGEVIDWGGWRLELFGGRRQYLAPVPDRFDGDGEWRLELNLGYSIGGDWAD
jgi:hypothetical protein